MHLRTREHPADTADVGTATVPTDALLVQASVAQAGAADLLQSLRGVLAGAPATSPWHGARLQSGWSPEAGRLYAYVLLGERAALAANDAHALQDILAAALGGATGLQVSRLERVFDVPGASAGQAPAFHYAVEMDPEAGWGDQLFDWYDTEHMPGLAKVDGCIRAQRLLNHDHGPLSLACYDLVMQEALGSPPWLAVRATDWSSRMRPHFTNTIRTMFDVLPGGWDAAR